MARQPTDKTLIDLARAKLESSGLDLKDAKELGIDLLTSAQADKLARHIVAARALKINYYDTEGKPLVSWPKHPPFWRVRYLENAKGFDGLTQGDLRYVQPAGGMTSAYFPKFLDWRGLAKNREPLIITEGELKAAKACKEGFACIGIGGVESWQAKKEGYTLIPDLQVIEWVGRRVYVCFDSDYHENTNVCSALERLTEEFREQGAFPMVVDLPNVAGDEGKTGIDDFFVHVGEDAPQAFADLLRTARPLTSARGLWDMNTRFAYVNKPPMIIEQKSGNEIGPGPFVQHYAAAKDYIEPKLEPNGEVSYNKISLAKSWLTWPRMFRVSRITYLPGQDKIVKEGDETLFNVWSGWGTEPKKGDVKPFYDLLDHLFTGAEEGAKEYFIQWCAYPIRHPGAKLKVAVVFHGIRQGTGKTLTGETLGRIYGSNYGTLSQKDILGSFNAWADRRQFVMGDDISGSRRREDADLIKTFITETTVTVNKKFVPEYTIPSCINYFFTSNHEDSFQLENSDRRFFVHGVEVGPLPAAFYRAYHKWLDNGGAEALHYHLKGEVDLSDFDPNAPARVTNAKLAMIDASKSDVATWCKELYEYPDNILRVGGVKLDADLYTAKELHTLYDPEGRSRVTVRGLARELRIAGFARAHDGSPLRLADGTLGKLWIVRNTDKWSKASPSDIAVHLKVPAEPKRKKY